MLTVNMHAAKTNLSKLIAGALKGQPFIIARAGKPLVKVEALEEEPAPVIKDRGLGSMKGKWKLPEDRHLPEQLDPQDQAALEALFHDVSKFNR
jgi:antitoxin (DNA-binding transcriptional repressor) of toxin-antitoxin stability system